MRSISRYISPSSFNNLANLFGDLHGMLTIYLSHAKLEMNMKNEVGTPLGVPAR